TLEFGDIRIWSTPLARSALPSGPVATSLGPSSTVAAERGVQAIDPASAVRTRTVPCTVTARQGPTSLTASPARLGGGARLRIPSSRKTRHAIAKRRLRSPAVGTKQERLRLGLIDHPCSMDPRRQGAQDSFRAASITPATQRGEPRRFQPRRQW